MNALKLRRWCFTINNPTDDDVKHLKTNLTTQNCIYAIVGIEQGELNTVHLQCFVHFRKQLLFNRAKAMLSCRAHLEGARGTDVQNKVYCEKGGHVIIEIGTPNEHYQHSNDTSNACYDIAQKMADGECVATICEDPTNCKVYTRHYKAIERITHSIIQKSMRQHVMDNGKDIVWKVWQQKIIKLLLKKPHERTVHWVYEETGNTGKTFLTRYIMSAHPSCICFENAKSADLKYAYNGENIVLFDLSRSSEHIFNYEALESLKNGRMFSPKYESASKLYNIHHVLVFANWMPDMTRLSLDRWNIIHISTSDNLYTNHTWYDIVCAHVLSDDIQTFNIQTDA